MRTRALKRIYALGPVLDRSRSLIANIDQMDASKRTQDDLRTREMAARVEAARHAADIPTQTRCVLIRRRIVHIMEAAAKDARQ